VSVAISFSIKQVKSC